MKLTKNENIEKYSKAIMPYLKSSKNQNYLTIFLTIGASIFFILFAINPTLSTIAKLKKEITDNKILDQKMSTKIDNLSSLDSTYPSIKDDISFIEDAAPKTPNATGLIGQIQSLGQEAGVAIVNIAISPVSLTFENAKNNSFNFTVNASGQFNDFSRFVDYLVSMQRALTIDSVQITKDQKEAHSVSATIKGEAYFKK